MNSQATSVTAWRLHRSATTARSVDLRKIDQTAFWDFCNTIEGRADIEDLLLEVYFKPEPGASSDFWGGGWSILWREEDADRWSWFIPKIFDFFKRKSPRCKKCPSGRTSSGDICTRVAWPIRRSVSASGTG
jgi:hypothetical protein